MVWSNFWNGLIALRQTEIKSAKIVESGTVRTQRRIVLHDPLVLYSVYNQDIFKFNDYHVCVEEEGKLTTGLTVPLEELLWVQFAYIDKNDYSLTRCATKVSSKIYFSSLSNFIWL